ncbi:MAG: nucleotidyltransferase domain-containing protein [Flavobacteriales bacterium]|nr:MAG: nucleotidyltransferase domain-containing protein [Flavobacteriales bacterium]
MFADLINGHRQQFIELCKSHRVKELYAFGSAVNGPFTASSDVDLLVELEQGDPIETGERLWSFWDRMELFFQRKVDLLTPRSLQNPVKKRHIDAHKKLIYDGQAGRLLC